MTAATERLADVAADVLAEKRAKELDNIAAMSDDQLTNETGKAKGHVARWAAKLDMLKHEAIKRMRANNATVLTSDGPKQIKATTRINWDVSRFHELREYLTKAEWDALYSEAYQKTVTVEAKMDTRKLATWARQRGGDFAEAVDAIQIREYRTVEVVTHAG